MYDRVSEVLSVHSVRWPPSRDKLKDDSEVNHATLHRQPPAATLARLKGEQMWAAVTANQWKKVHMRICKVGKKPQDQKTNNSQETTTERERGEGRGAGRGKGEREGGKGRGKGRRSKQSYEGCKMYK